MQTPQGPKKGQLCRQQKQKVNSEQLENLGGHHIYLHKMDGRWTRNSSNLLSTLGFIPIKPLHIFLQTPGLSPFFLYSSLRIKDQVKFPLILQNDFLFSHWGGGRWLNKDSMLTDQQKK